MRVTSVSLISCLLSLGSTLSIQPRALTKGENLVLLDCGIGNAPNGGSTSRQVAYYSGDIYKDAASGSYTTNPPTYLTNIPWDGSYPWRQSGITAKTSNGDEWKIIISPGVRDPNWAGYATHTYDSTALICWSLHGFGIYTLSDGTACTTAYVCNHQNGPPTTPKAPGPAPAPIPNFSHNFMGNEVTLVGDWSIEDLFKTAQLHDGGNGAQYCAGLDQKQTLPGTGKPGNPDCTIAFDCGPYNADVMLSVAKQVLKSRKEAYSVTTQDLPRCERDVTCLNPQACFETCHQGPDCYCKGDTSRKITTVGSGKTEIDMLGGSNPGQSRLTYKIDCPTAQQEHDCAVCMGLGKIKLVLDLFTFGIAGATTDFVCGLDGC